MKPTSARSDGRLPLTILGGFLGAGKSTWLRHQLHQQVFSRHHILVNEAAETPVDNLLLGKAAGLTVLAGGCACCAGLPSLLATLRDLCDAVSGAQAGAIEGILLETSGLAEPARIAEAIAGDPILVRRLAVQDIIVLVDARHGASQLASEPQARRQIEAAGRLVVTKPASAGPDTLGRLAATLARLNPHADLAAAEHGVPVPLPEGRATPYDLAPLETATPIQAFQLNVAGQGGWIGVSTWLSALLHARGDDIVRVKGVVRTPAGRLLLQSVRQIVQPPEILPESDAALSGPAPQEDIIVLIGRNISASTLQRSWQRFGGS